MTGAGGNFITFVASLLYVFVLAPAPLFNSGQISFLVIWCVGFPICTWLWPGFQSRWSVTAISLLPLGPLLMAPIAVTGMYSHAPLQTPGFRPGGEVIWLWRPRGSLGLAIRRARYEIDTFHCEDEYKLQAGVKADGSITVPSVRLAGGPGGRRPSSSEWLFA